MQLFQLSNLSKLMGLAIAIFPFLYILYILLSPQPKHGERRDGMVYSAIHEEWLPDYDLHDDDDFKRGE